MATDHRPKDVLTAGQVATICRTSPRTAGKWIDTGALKGYRLPGTRDRRVLVVDLMKFVVANGMPAEWLTDWLREKGIEVEGMSVANGVNTACAKAGEAVAQAVTNG